MLTIPTALLSTIAAQAPAAIGEIAFSIAVDRSRLSRHGLFDSVRSDMASIPTPAILERAVAHDPDELAEDMPTVLSWSSPSADFTITFVRFPGEAETDAYVVVDGTVLHTRHVGSRAFDLYNRMN